MSATKKKKEKQKKKQHSLPPSAQIDAKWLFIQSIYISQQVYLPWSQMLRAGGKTYSGSVDDGNPNLQNVEFMAAALSSSLQYLYKVVFFLQRFLPFVNISLFG